MKKYVLLGNDSLLRVQVTSFERKPGDRMEIDKVPYTVLHYGDQEECRACMNAVLQKVKQNRKAGYRTTIKEGVYREAERIS